MDMNYISMDEKKTEYLNRLSRHRCEKAMRIKRVAEQNRSIAAGILLETMLASKLSLTREQIRELKYSRSEHGKPYLTEYAGVHFNLSHSGDMVACAIADAPVGIDIQKIELFKSGVAKRFYSDMEQKCLEEVLSETEKTTLFYKIWAGKESYTKLLSTGLTIPLQEFSVDVVQKKVTGKYPCNLKFFSEYQGYCLCVAYKGEQEIILKSAYDVF